MSNDENDPKSAFTSVFHQLAIEEMEAFHSQNPTHPTNIVRQQIADEIIKEAAEKGISPEEYANGKKPSK